MVSKWLLQYLDYIACGCKDCKDLVLSILIILDSLLLTSIVSPLPILLLNWVLFLGSLLISYTVTCVII